MTRLCKYKEEFKKKRKNHDVKHVKYLKDV